MKNKTKAAFKRQMKLFMLVFLIVTIVTSAIELKGKAKGQGNLYCIDNGTVCSDRVDYIEFTPSDGSKPCGSTAGVANPVYKVVPNDCVLATGPFVASAFK